MSIKQLVNRRLINRISAAEVAREIGKSRSWVVRIEEDYRGPAFQHYKALYEEALDRLVDGKKTRVSNN